MVSATENALINTLETPLAVAWVWVCFAEVPTITSFVGGIIVMAAVAGLVWMNRRSAALAADE
jgi:drug/metabolite transporter (DMT)-like permease